MSEKTVPEIMDDVTMGMGRLAQGFEMAERNLYDCMCQWARFCKAFSMLLGDVYRDEGGRR